MKKIAFALGLLVFASPLAAQSPEQVAERALRAAPVWDGHNDVPIQLRSRLGNVIADFDFHDTHSEPDGRGGTKAMHTTFPGSSKAKSARSSGQCMLTLRCLKAMRWSRRWSRLTSPSG